jgi:hypothetical protein
MKIYKPFACSNKNLQNLAHSKPKKVILVQPSNVAVLQFSIFEIQGIHET